MRLKQLRRQHGISQLKLAMDLGLNQNSISRYESGEREADYQTLIRLADYFNVSVDYLTGVSNERATRKQNSSDLDAMLNTIHHILLDEYDTPVTYEGAILSEKQKLIIDQQIEQLRDTIELMLQLNV